VSSAVLLTVGGVQVVGVQPLCATARVGGRQPIVVSGGPAAEPAGAMVGPSLV